MKSLITGLALAAVAGAGAVADGAEVTNKWQAPVTVKDVVERYPEDIRNLLRSLDLDRKGLEKVKAAAGRGDMVTAGEELLEYYRKSDRPALAYQAPPPPGSGTEEVAENMTRDVFRLQFPDNRANKSFDEKVPRLPDGRLDWRFGGSNNRTHWVYLHWGVPDRCLLRAFEQTGNRRYVSLLSDLLCDWVVSVRYPSGEPRLDSGPRASASRFDMEVRDVFIWHVLWGRISSWRQAFCELRNVPEFTPAARLLMLSALPSHVEAMTTYHPGRGHNFALARALSLAAISVYWPEFKFRDAIFKDACEALQYELDRMFYPDGAYRELASTYAIVGAFGQSRALDILRKSDVPPPADYAGKVERAVNVIAYQLTPSGALPMRADSDLHEIGQEFLGATYDFAAKFHRPDWAYIASHGATGTKPKETSVVFPWAGQVFMRSGWDTDARWAFFDVGPSGAQHQHMDRLNLCISAYGRDLLVDAGRVDYFSMLHDWARSSAAHNVILVDGAGQQMAFREAGVPMMGNYRLEDDHVYARGVFDAGFAGVEGSAKHARVVLDVRNDYWIVVDHIETDRPRKIEPLWHFHPDCAVAAQGERVVTTDPDKGNLAIIPVAAFPWEVSVVKRAPAKAGDPLGSVYAAIDRRAVNNPVAVYRAAIKGPATFAWLLVPGKGEVPQPKVERLEAPNGYLHLLVTMPGCKPDEVLVRMSGNEPARLSDGQELVDVDYAVKLGDRPLRTIPIGAPVEVEMEVEPQPAGSGPWRTWQATFRARNLLRSREAQGRFAIVSGYNAVKLKEEYVPFSLGAGEGRTLSAPAYRMALARDLEFCLRTELKEGPVQDRLVRMDVLDRAARGAPQADPVFLGQKRSLSLKGVAWPPASSAGGAHYVSSRPEVAEVDPTTGQVTARRIGQAAIIASAGSGIEQPQRTTATTMTVPPNTAPPQIDFLGGDDILVQIITAEQNAEVYYTLDGSEPDRRSARYKDPFFLNASCVIKARAFAPGLGPSRIVAETAAFALVRVGPGGVTFEVCLRDKEGLPFSNATVELASSRGSADRLTATANPKAPDLRPGTTDEEGKAYFRLETKTAGTRLFTATGLAGPAGQRIPGRVAMFATIVSTDNDGSAQAAEGENASTESREDALVFFDFDKANTGYRSNYPLAIETLDNGARVASLKGGDHLWTTTPLPASVALQIRHYGRFRGNIYFGTRDTQDQAHSLLTFNGRDAIVLKDGSESSKAELWRDRFALPEAGIFTLRIVDKQMRVEWYDPRGKPLYTSAVIHLDRTILNTENIRTHMNNTRWACWEIHEISSLDRSVGAHASSIRVRAGQQNGGLKHAQ